MPTLWVPTCNAYTVGAHMQARLPLPERTQSSWMVSANHADPWTADAQVGKMTLPRLGSRPDHVICLQILVLCVPAHCQDTMCAGSTTQGLLWRCLVWSSRAAVHRVVSSLAIPKRQIVCPSTRSDCSKALRTFHITRVAAWHGLVLVVLHTCAFRRPAFKLATLPVSL